MMTANAGVGPLVERESGLIVPAHLARVPEEPAAEGAPREGDSKDPDGRRRVLISRDARKRMARLAQELGQSDLAFVTFCKAIRHTPQLVKDVETGAMVKVEMAEPIPGACGEMMLREGEGTNDPGFGCKCTRVHFTRF